MQLKKMTYFLIIIMISFVNMVVMIKEGIKIVIIMIV